MTAHKVIALDLGGTQIRAALFIGEDMTKRAALNTDISGGQAFSHKIDLLIGKVLGDIVLSDIKGIGMACALAPSTLSWVLSLIPTLPGVGWFAVSRDDGPYRPAG